MGSKAVMKVPFGFKGVHTCKAVVLMCLDFRFRKQTLYFAREFLGLVAFDLAGLPGSSNCVSKESGTALSCLSVPCDLHQVEKIVLVHHQDCGAYGGSGRFRGNRRAEQKFHERELRRARKLINVSFPTKEVVLVYARLTKDEESVEFLIVE